MSLLNEIEKLKECELMNQAKKYLWIVIVIAFIVTCFILLYQFPKRIDQQYSAFEYKAGDAVNGESVNVTIAGTVKRPLFRDQVFSGRIILDKYDFTATYELIDVGFFHSERGHIGSLTYTTVIGSKPELVLFGMIASNDDLDTFTIIVNQNDALQIEKQLRISAPATNYNEAIEIDTKQVR